MPQSSAPAEVVRSVAAGVSRLISGGLTPEQRETQLDDLAALYAEHTDVRHPFAPLGDTPLRTRAELREHFATSSSQSTGIERFEPVDAHVHLTADPEVVIFEFRYAGSASGRPFAIPAIFVVRVRDGVIVESRDYGDHVGFARVFDRLPSLAAALTSQAPAS
jgi:ketosteroid isomerase-like protein